MSHTLVEALDPPGNNRRWRCDSCRLTGSLDYVLDSPCTKPNDLSSEELLLKQLEKAADD